MRILQALILLTFSALVIFSIFDQGEPSGEQISSDEAVEKSFMLEPKTPPDVPVQRELLEGDIYHWIGKTEQDLIEIKGEPIRKDLSAYEYVWWVYHDDRENYMQFGMEEGEIRTVYAIGDNASLAAIQIGDSYTAIEDEVKFEDEVVYTDGVASFAFQMTDEDIIRRPLIKLSDDLFAQLYFDTFTNNLSSIRLMEADILLRHQPYEIIYRGTLPEKPNLTEEQWSQVERGMEQQIFDISNVIRSRFGQSKLEWNKEVSEVAYNHSKDMEEQNYFSHFSLNGDGLKERLDVTGIFYISAGENIAAQYPDAPSAVEGWLNSESHRDALLLEDYTHLGVGVHRFYYTQNFLAKPI
jgi:uncharacterized protein YkwD